MAVTLTPNIYLSKPDYSEPADIAVINANKDIIDGVVAAINNELADLTNKNIVFGSYAGNEARRPNLAVGAIRTITLGFDPKMLLIFNADYDTYIGGMRSMPNQPVLPMSETFHTWQITDKLLPKGSTRIFSNINPNMVISDITGIYGTQFMLVGGACAPNADMNINMAEGYYVPLWNQPADWGNTRIVSPTGGISSGVLGMVSGGFRVRNISGVLGAMSGTSAYESSLNLLGKNFIYVAWR